MKFPRNRFGYASVKMKSYFSIKETSTAYRILLVSFIREGSSMKENKLNNQVLINATVKHTSSMLSGNVALSAAFDVHTIISLSIPLLASTGICG